MKSWKTSVTGVATILAAVATAAKTLLDNDPLTNPDWTLVISAITSGLGLLFARDANVTSEQQGLTTATTVTK